MLSNQRCSDASRGTTTPTPLQSTGATVIIRAARPSNNRLSGPVCPLSWIGPPRPSDSSPLARNTRLLPPANLAAHRNFGTPATSGRDSADRHDAGPSGMTAKRHTPAGRPATPRPPRAEAGDGGRPMPFRRSAPATSCGGSKHVAGVVPGDRVLRDALGRGMPGRGARDSEDARRTAGRRSRLSTPNPRRAPQKQIVPPPWAPWSLLSSGAVMCLYSFTIPRRVAGG